MTAAPINRHIVLAAHPRGQPVASNFRLENVAVLRPSDGQVVLRTLVLSLDPYMRNLRNSVDPWYAPPVVPVAYGRWHREPGRVPAGS
jgi:NADPH-dependent curcumin reductase CurA